MTSQEILEALEALLGFDPEDGNLMIEGRKDHARLSISHWAATAILGAPPGRLILMTPPLG